MPDRPILIYSYDGSFDGLLCCVFESYEKREMPADVMPDDKPLPLLLSVKAVETEREKAQRVLRSIPERMGRDALDFVRRAFLTCHPQRSLLILRFLRLGYRFGPSVMKRLTDDTIHTLSMAVRHLGSEAHQYKGFVRFAESNGVLTAQIEPKNVVLPIIARHFCERYPNERFLIHDKTHDLALIHEPKTWTITAVENLRLPNPDENELKFRALWRLYYETIEIKGRHNPRCRMGHMPKRYWNCMTEFACEEGAPRSWASFR